jgi:hypothetical protein
MSSCIGLFYICISLLAGSLHAAIATQLASPVDDPDRLYANRAELTSAKRAADIWKSRVAAGGEGTFEAAWKLARAAYWLGGHAPERERRRFLEEGIEAARMAIALEPNRPEGHFWLAADMGALAESAGLRAGLKYRKPVKDELEIVRRLDPSFQQGSADRALGRWYFRVPRLFGGSRKQAEWHLRESLKYNEHNTASNFFLAEVLLKGDRTEEARAILQRVIDAPLDPEWTPEDREFKQKAQQKLEHLGARR